jgi:hypothetical protein
MSAATPFTAPVVDALTVRVLVDSRYERFLPKAAHPQVQIEHVGRIYGRPEMTFACEWRLSLHLTSEMNGAKAQYVLDFGYTPEIIDRNQLEAINPDVIVPMHCTGERFIDMLRQRMPEKVVYSNVGSRYTFGA